MDFSPRCGLSSAEEVRSPVLFGEIEILLYFSLPSSPSSGTGAQPLSYQPISAQGSATVAVCAGVENHGHGPGGGGRGESYSGGGGNDLQAVEVCHVGLEAGGGGEGEREDEGGEGDVERGFVNEL